jgi:hypothetical protein
MRYHSFAWWKIALIEQFKHVVRNIICRKWLKISFGYTEPDLLAMFVKENQNELYHIIVKKYPELNTLKKYLDTAYTMAVTDFLCAAIFLYTNKAITTMWTHNGNIEDIIFLLKNGLPSNIIMENVLGIYHSVLIVGYDSERESFIFNDPLGDPWTRYLIVYGFNINYSKDKLLKATGERIKMSLTIKSSDKEIIEKIKQKFNGRKLFFLAKEIKKKKSVLAP